MVTSRDYTSSPGLEFNCKNLFNIVTKMKFLSASELSKCVDLTGV